MSPSHPKPSEQGPKTPRSARHQASAGSSDPARSAPEVASSQDAIDPELIEDLGAEYELRGDVLEAELEALRVESAEHRDHAMRAQAEFDNFRKRITREREEERQRAGVRLVSEMLPAIDNLERAIAHAEGGGDLSHLLGGVQAVLGQLLAVLGKEGVEIIDPMGAHFDPLRHRAVSQQEDASVPYGTVVAVYQKGYALSGRVLREATVVVSTGGPPFEE